MKTQVTVKPLCFVFTGDQTPSLRRLAGGRGRGTNSNKVGRHQERKGRRVKKEKKKRHKRENFGLFLLALSYISTNCVCLWFNGNIAATSAHEVTTVINEYCLDTRSGWELLLNLCSNRKDLRTTRQRERRRRHEQSMLGIVLKVKKKKKSLRTNVEVTQLLSPPDGPDQLAFSRRFRIQLPKEINAQSDLRSFVLFACDDIGN